MKRRDGWMERERDLPRCGVCWVCCVWKFCLVIIIIIIVKGRGICDLFHVVFFRVERRYGTYGGQAVGECERSSGQDLHKSVMHIT